jgi:FkbM family methyltransferase
MSGRLRTALKRLERRLRRRSPKRDPYAITRELVVAREPMIFDVGANVGQTALRYRELFPSATIHCFEPFPPSFERLREALERDAKARLHLLALAASGGSARLKANRSAATNSLLASDRRAAHYWGGGLLDTEHEVEVQTRTLDEFCSSEGIGHVDVLKLDVQGAEYAVLEGAREMLAAQRIDVIYMEVITAPTYVGQRELHEYLALLHERGYRLFDFYNPARRDGRLIQSDVIVVSTQFLERYEGARTAG